MCCVKFNTAQDLVVVELVVWGVFHDLSVEQSVIHGTALCDNSLRIQQRPYSLSSSSSSSSNSTRSPHSHSCPVLVFLQLVYI